MIKCIYCLEVKSKMAFIKKEHVLPQSFGKFKDNFTLINTVCDECNQFFGDNLELPLARDTYEGTLRFSHEIKAPKEFKSLGIQGRIRTKFVEGQLKGVISQIEYSEEQNKTVMMPVDNQIGFICKETNERIFFLLSDIPTRDELLQLGVNFDHPKSMILFKCDPDLASKKLKEIGITFKFVKEEQGTIEKGEGIFEMHGTIDTTIQRAIAKISFNYFTYIFGKETALSFEFNEIRKFIRYEETQIFPIVNIVEDAILGDEPSEGLRRSGHIITVENSSKASVILSRVTLNNMFTYVIFLSRNSNTKIEDSGHFFYPHKHLIMPLKRSTT